MGIGKRIKEARENLGLTQIELADLVGVTGSAITNYEKETSHPKEAVMYKLFDALNVDANYLFQDVVNIPKKVNDVTLSEFEHIKKYRNLDEHGRHVIDLLLEAEYDRSISSKQQTSISTGRLIQFYPKLASAGTGQIVFDDVPVDLIEIPDVPEYKRAKYAIGVNGASMEPMFSDGDILLVEPAPELSIGEIGIFLVDGQSYVKRLGEGSLISLNSDYPNIDIDENTTCLGRVIDKVTSKPVLSDADISALNNGLKQLMSKDA